MNGLNLSEEGQVGGQVGQVTWLDLLNLGSTFWLRSSRQITAQALRCNFSDLTGSTFYDQN